MVLDIAELDFIGAAGLLAVSNAEKRLAELGAELTVRSTSDLVNRLLDLMEQAEVSDSNEHFPSTAISDQRTWAACLSSRSSLVVVARARIPAGQPPCRLTRSCVSGADGVSVCTQARLLGVTPHALGPGRR